jgi:tetratricopeptide (TPR) repeat protein
MNLHLSRGELAQSNVISQEILDRHPNDPVAILGRGVARIGLRQFAEARADLESLLARNLLVNEATFQLARLDVQDKNIASAEKRLRILAERNPEDDRAQVGLAQVLSVTGRGDEARQVLAGRVAAEPERLDSRFDLALYSARAGQSGQAIDDLNEILRKEPRHNAARVLLAELLRREGEFAEAKKHYLAAAEGDKPSAVALVRLGVMEASGRNFAAASQYFDRAVTIAPDDPVAHNNLAYVLAEANMDLDRALSSAQKAKSLAPESPDFTDTLGLVYLKRGMNTNAAELLRGIVTSNPDRVPFRYHYAMALAGAGNREQAVKELETALSRGPTIEEERQIRNLLRDLKPAD